MTTETTQTTVDFLVRAARVFRRGGYVFTGFHWPVLAGHLAWRLSGDPFVQVFEAGATSHGPAWQVPTSTTDYPAYADVCGYRGSTADVLFALVRRCDRVVLDAANVDLAGRVNATAIGPYDRPQVRLAGGGGAADAAASARELVLLHGGDDPRRLQDEVAHVTAAPGPQTAVELHTRWGVLSLGRGEPPVLRERVDTESGGDPDGFLARLASLGVDTTGARFAPPVTAAERRAAADTLRAAAARGYRAAVAASTPPACEEESRA